MPLIKQNGRTRQGLRIAYTPPASNGSGWQVRFSFVGDQTKKYLQLWRRRSGALDEVSFALGLNRYRGYAKITNVAVVLTTNGATKLTEVTWTGLGTPEITAVV